MKCHYEVLGVSQTATYQEIEKAYQELESQLHPDNNIDNPKEAEEQYRLVQQAWEVLSDHQESSWYDKHRESILNSDHYFDDGSINIFCYFRTDCFKNYEDDENGFYTVYRLLFDRIAEEENFEANDFLEKVPTFGYSGSSYEDMCKFYDYWDSYVTKKSFNWLNLYDVRFIVDRNVARFVEEENWRIRNLAIQGRNQLIRTLVAFVKKRDKRVREFGEFLEERENENVRMLEEFGWIELFEKGLFMDENFEEDEENEENEKDEEDEEDEEAEEDEEDDERD